MKANERRNAILQILCERRYEKIENLAFEFGVSRRTICYDITELSLSYPIYTEQGKYTGGIYIDENYRLKQKYLSKPESALLQKLCGEVPSEEAEILQNILYKFTRKI